MFDSKTGFYIRSGIIDENGKDKNMRSLRNFMKLINDIVGICRFNNRRF